MLIRWYRYIIREYDTDIIYHTFHSTKGLEYDNVIIIFGDSFGKRKSNFFKYYFEGYNQNLSEEEMENYRKARNLLYVAVTRARKNLRILFTGEYQSKKEVFDSVFGKAIEWHRTKGGE